MNPYKRPPHPLFLILILAGLATLVLVGIGRPAPSIAQLEQIQGTVGSIGMDRTGRAAALDLSFTQNPDQVYTVVPDARIYFPLIMNQVHYGMRATVWAAPAGLFGKRQIWQLETPGHVVMTYSQLASTERHAWFVRIFVAIVIILFEVVVFMVNMRRWNLYKSQPRPALAT